tara:strand:+ start:115 stop:825 length:711 start_codon:yes stop_codon:yes gene_type:complete
MQQPAPHQVMGYDRAITMFSPDGRLLQVEYAKKTVKQGSTAIAMVCKDGVLFVTDKRILDTLMVASAIEKVWQIDDHIGVTGAGIISDARVLIERARVTAQQHKVTYDAPIDVISVVKDLADLKQMTTQSGGLRPFGVSLLIGGIDEEGMKVFQTDPTGIYFEYQAVAIGEGEQEVMDILHKKYKSTITMQEGIKIAVAALKQVLGNNFSLDRVDVASIPLTTKRYTKIAKEQIQE